MLQTFFRHYLELPSKKTNIVCLGGGIGTAQILKGLRIYPYNLTAVVSMADDGGSAGRLRRAFSVPPPGDIVNCLAALSEEESVLKKLFIYRFSGKRYGKDTDLGGQKLGNLIFVALADIYKENIEKALEEFSKIISSKGRVLPATIGDVNIWAKTSKGIKVYGEEKIDLGLYDRDCILEQVYLDPPNARSYKPTIESLKEANIIIAGPGDLFSTVLPVLIVPEIKKIIRTTTSRRVFIVNTTNKPYETPNFKVSDYLFTLKKHLGGDYFDTIIVNTNQKPKMPSKINYKYVTYDRENLTGYWGKIIEGNYVNSKYPLYHESSKVAQAIIKL